MTILAEAFLKNRAEQLPADVSDQFIVPPFFGRISIFADTKSVRILGGRGCGKTMFIRHFCHSTTFSPSKRNIDDAALRSVGLYLRPDTGFCSLMTNNWLGAEASKLAFLHYVTLQLLAEAHHAFVNIAAADLAAGQLNVLNEPISSALALQFSKEVTVVGDLGNFVEVRLSELELWVRNPKRCEQPMFLSFASVLPRLAEDLAKLTRLKDLSFRAFIDEFENLAEVQRMVVCDAIKHPSLRLAVHIAHKRDAVTDFKTSSDERIVELHDLRKIDLEEQLSHENEFELLAAELFLLRLHLEGVRFGCSVFDPQKLHDPAHLPYRLSQEYRTAVVGRVREILPRLTATDIAKTVMQDEPLKRRLAEMINKGLVRHQLSGKFKAADLIDPAKPRASIVLGALLNRSGDPAPMLEAFQSISGDKPNGDDPFYKSGGWVDNNLYGCLFHLYAGLPQRNNLLYAGFERFCQLARPSLRYFQELCHVTLLLAFQRSERSDIEPVSYEHQAQAARHVSDAMFEDVPQLGLHGEKLREMVRRLGAVFEAFNRRPGQSEPEINHFSIDESDKAGLSEAAQQILKEARTWSVLYEEPDTKNKSDYDIAQSDWVLNRIYAPHFGISYRKRRKVTLKAGQINTILCQSSLLFESLLKDIVAPEQPAQGGTGQLF